MTRSLSSISNKHDDDCLRRRARKNALFLCTCGLTDAEVIRAFANPHSRAKSGLTEGVGLVDTPNRAGDAANVPAHGTEGNASMQDDPTAKRPIIGRERALIDKLTNQLADAANKDHWATKSYLEGRRHGSFEVAIRVDNKPTGHVARVTVELDRFDPDLEIDHG